MISVARSVRLLSMLFLLETVLPAAGQTGGMQSGPFDGMSSNIVVPAAVRVDGKNGAFFQTDLWIRCQTVPIAATLFSRSPETAST